MTTLRELVDDNYVGGQPIVVIAPSGETLGTIRPGEEEDAFALGSMMGGKVLKTVDADGSVYAYVEPPATAPGSKSITPSIYQGAIADEAAWSADWRSRERKASAKQLAFLRKHLPLYRQIKKPQWPDDPAALLAHEASDAMTTMLEVLKYIRGAEGED